jgi:outer membrane autotransporter protein
LTTLNGLNTPQVRFTLDQLSGEVYAFAVPAGIENQALWLRTLGQHIRLANECLCPATEAGGESGCDGDGAWRTWATPFGQAGVNRGDGNAHAFEYNTVGFAAGSDRRVGDEGNGLVGLAAGYSNWGNTTNLINSNTDSNSFNLGGYARAQLGQAWLLGITSYEYDGYHSRRPMDLLGLVANANFSGNQLGEYIEGGYAINFGGLQMQPLVSAQYISTWRNSVSETGAGALDLNVRGTHADSFRTQLGSRFLYPITTSAGRCILPEAGAYWIHEFAQNSREDVNQFAGGGPVFLANGANLGRDFGLFTTGFSTQMGPSLRTGFYYTSYISPTAVVHGGMGQVQIAW